MYEYYFKIKKGDIEFEFSTSDKTTFEEQLSDWINGIVKGEYVAPPMQTETQEDKQEANEEKPERSGFIDVKNLTSINKIQTPDFDLTENLTQTEQMPETDFAQALEDSISNPKTEVVEKTENNDSFSQYIQKYTPQNQLDFLIVTASYLLNVERKECFSIKQLNAKLIPYFSGTTGKPVDHSDIEEAINQNLIRIVPDLTGTSEVTEYTLTEQGYGYFVE